MFLGGLPSSITETDLRSYFSQYGEVCEVVIMYDQEKKKSRGFGFLSFLDDASCTRAVAQHYVTLQNKKVEVKRAEPRINHHEVKDWPLSSPHSESMGGANTYLKSKFDAGCQNLTCRVKIDFKCQLY